MQNEKVGEKVKRLGKTDFDPHFHRTKEVIMSMTARQAQITPAITPLLNHMVLCGNNGGALLQSRIPRTFCGAESSPRITTRLSIALRVPPHTTISYTLFIVRFGMIICE